MVSGAGAFGFAAPAGRLRAGCGLCGWLEAGGLEAVRLAVICWPRGLWAVAPACWLWRAVLAVRLWPGGCAPGGLCCRAVGLEAVPLCCDRRAACLLAVGFTWRPPPLLAVRLCPMAWSPCPWWAVLLEGWRLAAIVGRRSYRPPVPLEDGRPPVLCFWLASCLPVCWSWPPPRNTPRKTPGKRRENFQQFFRRGILRARSKSCYLVY